MKLELVGFFLDIIVIGLLGVMIFYALRLSKSLNDFRSHRQEFDGILIKLLSNIDHAERAIQNLKQVSARETSDLNQLIKQAKALSGELQIINEAGENMAKRLENLAEKNRKIAQSMDPLDQQAVTSPQPRTKPFQPREVERPQPRENKTNDDFPSFMIKDRDAEAADPYPSRPPLRTERAEEPAVKPQSQAERELLEALQKNKKNFFGKGT